MTAKENEDLAHYFMTFLHEAKEQDDAAEVANLATDMVKQILSNNPKIRYIMWQYSKEDILDELGLDYGGQ